MRLRCLRCPKTGPGFTTCLGFYDLISIKCIVKDILFHMYIYTYIPSGRKNNIVKAILIMKTDAARKQLKDANNSIELDGTTTTKSSSHELICSLESR